MASSQPDPGCRGRTTVGASLRWVVTLLSAGMLGGGCMSLGMPRSAQFACVTIGDGTSAGQIRGETIRVFEREGYRATRQADNLVFDREATQGEALAYGNLMTGSVLRMRVKAQVVPLGAGAHRLQCTAYAVKNAGWAAEEESRLFNIQGKPYQALLDRVARNLAEPEPHRP